MTAQERRAAVTAKYGTLIGRNLYSQPLRDYCFRRYNDGNYYSDCSSSICYTYSEAGEGWGITNTAGMYTSGRLETVDVKIKDGIPDVTALRSGDMLLFAGNDASRPQKIGHVEMVYSVDGDKAILCGHGSGRPSCKELAAYCRSRYNTLAPGGWRKGLVCVRRYIVRVGTRRRMVGGIIWVQMVSMFVMPGIWPRTASGTGLTAQAGWSAVLGTGIRITGTTWAVTGPCAWVRSLWTVSGT